jgi:hypothetical protein
VTWCRAGRRWSACTHGSPAKDASEGRVRLGQLEESLSSIREQTAGDARVGDRIVDRVTDELVVLEQIVVRMLREGDRGEDERVDRGLAQEGEVGRVPGQPRQVVPEDVVAEDEVGRGREGLERAQGRVGGTSEVAAELSGIEAGADGGEVGTVVELEVEPKTMLHERHAAWETTACRSTIEAAPRRRDLARGCPARLEERTAGDQATLCGDFEAEDRREE